MSKIAVIDDASTIGKILAGYVKSIANAQTTVFTCPKVGLAWCITNEPDMVLLDYEMPDMDGIEFLRRFRTEPHLKDVPVVMITGAENRETLYEALYSGATDFLRKPVDRIELVARARTMLELRSRQKQLVDANRELYRLATTDQLTGIGNRRFFLDALSREIEHSIKDKRPLSIFVADADHFKKINDTYGHDVGDKVLIALANALSQCCRETDFVGRLGGEEFAMVLPGIDLERGERICARLTSMVRQVHHEIAELQDPVTVSIGLTDVSCDGDNATAVLKRADLSLYQAKAAGRDRVVVLPVDAKLSPLATPAEIESQTSKGARTELSV